MIEVENDLVTVEEVVQVEELLCHRFVLQKLNTGLITYWQYKMYIIPT